MQLEIQVIISFLSGLGAGIIGSYIGVKVALAEMRSIQTAQGKTIDDHGERLKYVERRSHT